MDSYKIQASTYFNKAFKSLIILAVYWSIVYFIYKSNYKSEFSLTHIANVIEVVSAFTIILSVVILVSKFFGNIIVGFIIAAIILIIAFSYGDQYMTAHNLSDRIVENICLAMGIFFNVHIVIRFILGMKNYRICKSAIKYNLPTCIDSNISEKERNSQ